jgi:hypothetical protein
MNEAIAYMAKTCAFDAAHYTWIFIGKEKLRSIVMSTLEKKMLAHGDYSAPLRTREVKQPFDNMAIVADFGGGEEGTSYAMFTFDCRDSMLYEINMWGGIGEGSTIEKPTYKKTKILTLHFRPRPEQFKGVPPASEEHNPEGKSLDALTLVSMPPELPQHIKDAMVRSVIPTTKMIALYIPCASEGLLQGEELEYYKPSNMGNNEKRKRKGKSALYEWRTVTLERKRHGLPSAPKGGTHASPRLHQRRGHWVTSKLGKRFWRAEAVVGKAENGMIFHDYEDKSQKENQHARY